MATKQNVPGEGNEASRRYNEAVRNFTESRHVYGRRAYAAEAQEMKTAEQAALLMPKGGKKNPPPDAWSGKPQSVDDPGRLPGALDADQPDIPPRPGRGPDRR